MPIGEGGFRANLLITVYVIIKTNLKVHKCHPQPGYRHVPQALGPITRLGRGVGLFKGIHIETEKEGAWRLSAESARFTKSPQLRPC